MSTHGLEVILTHEHTDFDALASLLAAALLFPGARPVLPSQLNRNVAEFLALYKNHFSFLSAKELPRGRIERVIIVDTRTANLPKGVQPQTTFSVIDHHTVTEAAPADWQVWSEPVGANTTLLVEKLIEHTIDLSPVQATLLALGIHEDTGSLTYASTTARDARCLAWLMEPEQGVNLEIVQQFLRHPLSAAQRELLQLLIDQSEFLEVAGHRIVLAGVDAPDFEGELSTLAHRLRDIYETDAIFLVVGLGDIVQVVARSVTDAIDVGAVARALGGGGHPRAAAAPVRARDVESVQKQIVELLPTHSQPAVTVRHIMTSGRPQMVPPDLPIAEAYALMHRYGHEGYPVVEQGAEGRETLLGMLTRRDADRAINHQLGEQPVRRFMQSGQLTVRPTDSIPTLRRLMIERGWGQIPVVDEAGKIIGIVTRTDLIKLWDETTPPQRHADEIDRRLRALLAADQVALLELVGQEVERLGYAVYVVGGFVRDLLLNRASEGVRALDMDIVIEGDAIAFAEHMQARYGGRVVAHRRFGTAKWLLDDITNDLIPTPAGKGSLPPHLDFVTARTEFYTEPTVLPTVELSNIKLDLHRRDFTINTLAFCLNPDRWGDLLDFYGGLADLERGLVRVLHSLSFVDDPTRILRAVRYEQRFGFQIEPRTLELLQAAAELLDRVTPTRLRHELERILQEAAPEKSLQRLADLGVLTHILPGLTVESWVVEQFAHLRTVLGQADADPRLLNAPLDHLYWGLWTMRLPPAVGLALPERLGLSRAVEQLISDLYTLQEHLPGLVDPQASPSQIVATLDKIAPIAQALLLATGVEPAIAEVLRRYTVAWRHIRPELTGADLKALGLPPGPLYGKILTRLRTARLDGLIGTRAEEVALAKAIAAAEPQSGLASS